MEQEKRLHCELCSDLINWDLVFHRQGEKCPVQEIQKEESNQRNLACPNCGYVILRMV